MGTLYDRLKKYRYSDYYGFHMPGHKRVFRPAEDLPYGLDITEIEGFDDLHHAQGILKEAQERATEVFGAQETHFLVNGSTAGILSALLGSTDRGDTVLVARNCHKSVYHAIEMQGLTPVYLYPEFDPEAWLNAGISAEDVREALEKHPQAKAVVIVSPTYDGVVSDVAAIAETVHKKGLPLIVDEAHGAHFGFHPYFPASSNSQGADIVIHSLHKTLPSLTQTALLHMNGQIADRGRVREYLHMLQTSSPSYVLMASMDLCVELLKEQGDRLFAAYTERLEALREGLKGLKILKVAETDSYDRSKIVVSVKDAGMTGSELAEVLRKEYHLQMEMAAGTYVLAMTSAGDTQEGFDRLWRALLEIDRRLCEKTGTEDGRRWEKALPGIQKAPAGKFPRLEMVYTCAKMKELRRKGAAGGTLKTLPLGESVGAVAAEYAYLYPPGTPLVVPGERMTEEAAEALLMYQRLGFSIEGLHTQESIEVWLDG